MTPLWGLLEPFFLWCYQDSVWCPTFVPFTGQEAFWLKDRLLSFKASPSFCLHALGTDSLKFPSCLLFSASAFTSLISIWCSSQSTQEAASSHSHLEYSQRELGFSLSCPSGIDVLGRDSSPFLLYSLGTLVSPFIPPNAVIRDQYWLFSSFCRERWLLKTRQSFVGKSCFTVCCSVR